jgi:serine/threonine protein kinase
VRCRVCVCHHRLVGVCATDVWQRTRVSIRNVVWYVRTCALRARLRHRHVVTGTPDYVAPEVLRGEVYDHSVDLVGDRRWCDTY